IAEFDRLRKIPDKVKRTQAINQLLTKEKQIEKTLQKAGLLPKLSKNTNKLNKASQASKVNKVEKLKRIGPIGDPSAKFRNAAPKNWISKTANNGKGTKYINPQHSGDYIRFMSKNPHPSAPIGQQKPYFIRIKDGNKILTKNGKWVVKGAVNPSETHIPQEMFDKLLPFMKFN
ncbi:MAG: hypothetical protein AAF380_03410, partial [Bacteroidota bacterium]